MKCFKNFDDIQWKATPNPLEVHGEFVEVTIEGETGYIVPKDNPQAAAEKLVILLKDGALRRRMGKAGRQHVLDHYTCDKSVDNMLDAYVRTIQKGSF